MKTSIIATVFVAQLSATLWLPPCAGAEPPPLDPLTWDGRQQQKEDVCQQDLNEGVFLKRWLVLGPFQAADSDGSAQSEAALERAFDHDFLADADGETSTQPRAGSTWRQNGKEYRWQFLASDGDAVDLGGFYGEETNAIAYAWAEIEMAQAKSVLLGLGSDDAIKVWCNGQLVHRNWAKRNLHPDDDLVPVHLRAGTNSLLVKIQNRTGGWGFACRALDPRAKTDKLIAAVRRNDLAGVRLLVSHGAPVNEKDQHGFTAWHLAQIWDRDEVAKCLQAAGADRTIAMPMVGTPTGMLALVWATLKENHPGLELVGAIDNNWYEAGKTKLNAISNLAEALPIIDEALVRPLQDFHTSLHWPTKASVSYLPVEFGFVENQLIVCGSRVTNGPIPGDIVVELNGQNARERFESVFAQTLGPTRYERIRAACRHLAQGLKGSRATLKLRDASGQVREVTLERGSSSAGRGERLISGRNLDERTGYIHIAAWTGWSIDAFDALLERMRDKPSLIIDVHENGGGQDQLADLAIGRFLSRPVLTSLSFRRVPKTDDYTKRLHLTKPRGPWRYEGRVAVLINEGCHSACEHFLSGMQLAGATLVGRPTSGGCGGIQSHELPLGITLYCSRSISLHGDRSPLAGIEPHHLVEPTIADIREGRDAFLEKTMAVLK
ncbi:MAG: hypothetical protein HZA90_17210 [Verrucomicrobia bacterium]|nr:hypothetical protein [Verrucomicrobiota bacterium]